MTTGAPNAQSAANRRSCCGGFAAGARRLLVVGMREIGAFEAKNKLGSLLDQVERGEEITITRRGKPVARLVRIDAGFDREKARAAVERVKKLRKGSTLGGLSIKALIEHGRK
jgi:prevent-host-death family protein